MSELEKLNLKQLKEMARDLDIPNRSKLRKSELVLALLQAQKQTAVNAAPVAKGNPAPLPETTSPAASLQSSLPAEERAQPFGPNGDPGLPIPDHYGTDKVVLLVQDPHHIFAYWELEGGALQSAQNTIGEAGTPVLVLAGPNGAEQREINLADGSYYLAVSAATEYSVAIALRDSNGRLHLVTESGIVCTPPDGASQNLDEEWMAVDETFHELLDRAGLPGEGLSSAERIRAAELQHRLWSTTRVTPMFSGTLAQRPDQMMEEFLSSHNLGSHSLGSHTLSSRKLVR